MTHPIIPPSELVQQWMAEPEYATTGRTTFHTTSKPRLTQMLTRAAQWGADQELEACCGWLDRRLFGRDEIRQLHAARRPKPMSLKEQALALLEVEHGLNVEDLDLLRRALEALPE